MAPRVRKGTPNTEIDRDEFHRRFLSRFRDPAFEKVQGALDEAEDVAWDGYAHARKAPTTQDAGAEFQDPLYKLSIDWIAARDAIGAAAARHADKTAASSILIINASPRNEHTCPGEMSKTYRLAETAREIISSTPGFECQFLDLSHLTSEYGRQIFPCKACYSTSPALCHWPCSCYPNHGLGQSPDWMNEIYPLWVAAHGIMIVTPVHWYHAPGALKLMMDRLVCADGGNPDPTTTHGKDAARAKALEAGWPYPRHLRGRVFSIIAHGDTAGVETLRRSLTDWLTDMHMEPAGTKALLDRYVGYFEPYSESHDALDRDTALLAEVRNAVLTLIEAVERYRSGLREAGSELADPRPH